MWPASESESESLSVDASASASENHHRPAGCKSHPSGCSCRSFQMALGTGRRSFDGLWFAPSSSYATRFPFQLLHKLPDQGHAAGGSARTQLQAAAERALLHGVDSLAGKVLRPRSPCTYWLSFALALWRFGSLQQMVSQSQTSHNSSPYHVHPSNNLTAIRAFQERQQPTLHNISTSPLLSASSRGQLVSYQNRPK